MSSMELSAAKLFAWRRRQLAKGGRAVDLDWLLDLGGGLSWSSLRKLYLDTSSSVVIEKPLSDLSKLWNIHLDDHTPLQYLIGRCPWRDFELEVTPVALIPRQETEILVDLALQKTLDIEPPARWVDLGTGSGAIAVALARSLTGWIGHAVDCSEEALYLAERNLKRLASKSQWKLHLGNWWKPLTPWWGDISLVLVNPPYIPNALVDLLEPEVRDHEPHLALCGGHDGLSACRIVICGAIKGLAPGGWLMLEHHYDQSDVVLDLMRQVGLINVGSESDLQGIRRFAIGQHPGNLLG